MAMLGRSSAKDLLTTTGTAMEDTEKCLDSQLWHACAGGMVQMPSVNSKVYYFPQGHAEHAQCPADFGNSPTVPAFVLSRVTAVRFMADPETDEVYAKIRLVPVQQEEHDCSMDEAIGVGCNGPASDHELQEKPASFAKTLTQSDANNGGGFSVPRYCAETIFPRLDYSAAPPVQHVLAKDVHGGIWRFRHIYRGTPRRHLLTTGWSAFVNQKGLVAGDSIVFLRTGDGDLCVGIRRAKRGIGGWSLPMSASYGGFSVFPREEESRPIMRGEGRVRAEAVIGAARRAARGEAFEVVYYPRASTPEFCVKEAAVRAAMGVKWCAGTRFKVPFETEDSSRISWFMGTISSVQAADPIWWPASPWRLLQVTWDEPDLLQNVKRVSPWLVETLISNMPPIHLPAPFSPPRKRLCIPPHTDFRPPLPFPSTLHGPMGSPLCCPSPAGIQGARHAQHVISLSDPHLCKLQSRLFHAGLLQASSYSPAKVDTTCLLVVENPVADEDTCWLTIGSPPSTDKPCSGKRPSSQLVLFGQPILTEQQINSLASSAGSSGNSSSDMSASSGSHHQKGGEKSPSWFTSQQGIEMGLETGHCKVFMDSEDVGRSLDLSVFGSYGELYGKLADMFGIDRSERNMGHVIYMDAAGAVKHAGDAPFTEFMRTARRLTIVMDSGSDTIGSCTSKCTAERPN